MIRTTRVSRHLYGLPCREVDSGFAIISELHSRHVVKPLIEKAVQETLSIKRLIALHNNEVARLLDLWAS